MVALLEQRKLVNSLPPSKIKINVLAAVICVSDCACHQIVILLPSYLLRGLQGEGAWEALVFLCVVGGFRSGNRNRYYGDVIESCQSSQCNIELDTGWIRGKICLYESYGVTKRELICHTVFLSHRCPTATATSRSLHLQVFSSSKLCETLIFPLCLCACGGCFNYLSIFL